MVDKINCREAMGVHLKRFWWNIVHVVWDFKTPNPHDVKGRKAYQDLGHSTTNIPVEFARACPYAAGHVWLWQTVITIVILILHVVL